MAMMKWPWLLNQPMPENMGYPAELVRAQHYAATSGGNGVSSPTAMKVMAQPAPDGTVRIQPGGADVVSTYAGQSGQSYNLYQDVPESFEVSPTGSQERHDIVIARVCDPDHDTHPDVSGEITPEQAAGMQFWWYEVIEGRSPSTFNPSYPYVPLARIMRGPNRTIVEPEDIRDIRELSNPKHFLHMRANNLSMSDAQSLHTGTSVWPIEATHTTVIPEWATRVQIYAAWGTVHSHRQAGQHGPASGTVTVALVLPGDSTINTQQSTWRTDPSEGFNRFNIVLGDNRPIPERFRGQEVRVELRGTKSYGPNIYMDGDSTWTLQLYFEQEVA